MKKKTAKFNDRWCLAPDAIGCVELTKTTNYIVRSHRVNSIPATTNILKTELNAEQESETFHFEIHMA